MTCPQIMLLPKNEGEGTEFTTPCLEFLQKSELCVGLGFLLQPKDANILGGLPLVVPVSHTAL